MKSAPEARLNVIKEFEGSFARNYKHCKALQFQLDLPDPDESKEVVVFFESTERASAFISKELDYKKGYLAFDLSQSNFSDMFPFNLYGGNEPVSDREAFARKLLFPNDNFLGGKILSREMVDAHIQCNMSFTAHSLHNTDLVFFSNRHMFGYKTLTDSWVSCTFSPPLHVVKRPGLESGNITNIEEFISVYEKDSEILWSVDELLNKLGFEE